MKKVIDIITSLGRLLLVYVLIPLVLIFIGYSHVTYLFIGEFTQHLGSIEVSYIQMAKFISHSLPELSWQPRWYLGYPMSVLYTPFVPYFEFFANQLLGWSYSHAYRVLTAASYVGALVTLYLFAKTWFKNTVAGFVTALCYGILPSIISILYGEVATDRFALDFVEPRRFTILVRWGEGPHIVSLLFLPLAGLFLVKFLRQGNKWMLLLGSICTGLVALTNSVGTWGMVILFGAIVIGEIVEGKYWKQAFWRSVVFGLVSFGLVSFWFNPLFLSTFFKEGASATSFWRSQFPWGWIFGIGGISFYIYVAKKILKPVYGVSGSLLFFALMFWFVNTYYSSGSEKVELVPQVLRLNTEVDIGFALLGGSFVGLVGTILLKFNKWFYLIAMTIVTLIAAVGFAPRQMLLSKELPRHTKSAEEMGVELTTIPEYEVAKTLEKSVSGGERVLVPGNYAFYLNYFTELPQLRGALFQSSVHPWPEHVYFQVTNGRDANISLAWLKIANVGRLVYGGPRELFRDFVVPTSKFDDTLELIEEKSGDRYYKVPLKNSSLVKAVPSAINTVEKPKNAIDEKPIMDYVTYLEQSNSSLKLSEEGNGKYTIVGTTENDEQVLVQMAYASGWKARGSSGKNLGVSADPLGFILIKPDNSGEQAITLQYEKPMQIWIGWLITGTTVVVLVIILTIKRKALLLFEEKQSKSEN